MIAFKTYAQAPTDTLPDGIPLSAVWMQQSCDESEYDQLIDNGFMVVSDEEYDAYVSDVSAELDEYLNPSMLTRQNGMFTIFDNETVNFINARYSLDRQLSLSVLRDDARADGLTNRFDYISQVLAWTNAVLYYHFTKQTEIYSTTTHEELDAITWDFTDLSASDPLVSIEVAMGIMD